MDRLSQQFNKSPYVQINQHPEALNIKNQKTKPQLNTAELEASNLTISSTLSRYV